MMPTMPKAFIVCALATIAGLAQAAPAAASPPISPARQAAVEAEMPQWAMVKQRAQRLNQNFLNGVSSASQKYDPAVYKGEVQTAWHVCGQREKKETKRQQQLLAQLAASVSAGTLSPIDGASRSSAINKVFQLRMLYLYGTLLPRMLDTSVKQQTVSIGRGFAGSEWKIEVTDQEMQALYAQYKSASAFAPSQIDQDY